MAENINYKNYKALTVGLPQFDKIRNDGRLLIEYVRGSTAYGVTTPDSDIDTGGVYMCTIDELLGYKSYHKEVSDAKSDNKWYELSNFLELAEKANPNILEALFVDERFIIGDVHPIMQYLRDNRDLFLTKKCFPKIFGFAVSQIEKARGLNKKIVNPIKERKTILDFTYTFKNKGSQNIVKWLEERNLKTEFCGLNNIPHMENIYGLYYDFGNHLKTYPEDLNKLTAACFKYNILDCKPIIGLNNIDNIRVYLKKLPVYHYKGLIAHEFEHTTQLKLSSIPDKTMKPLCWVSYNQSGFQKHCKDYKEYKDWEKNRNPARYKSNLDKNYDSKNIYHCFRLIHMGQEIAQGKSMILYRTWDKDFLLNIRNHKYEYDELINKLEIEKQKMNDLIDKSNLPDEIDMDKLNKILIELRLKQINERNNK